MALEPLSYDINASFDLLLIAFDYEKFFDAIYCAKKAFDINQIDQDMLEKSRQRLMRIPNHH